LSGLILFLLLSFPLSLPFSLSSFLSLFLTLSLFLFVLSCTAPRPLIAALLAALVVEDGDEDGVPLPPLPTAHLLLLLLLFLLLFLLLLLPLMTTVLHPAVVAEVPREDFAEEGVLLTFTAGKKRLVWFNSKSLVILRAKTLLTMISSPFSTLLDRQVLDLTKSVIR